MRKAATPLRAVRAREDRAGRGGPIVRRPDRDRNAVYSYYRTEYAAGHCPPGLAKKNNGCLPPGQAKKMWQIGQPLPAGVYDEALPPALLGRLSPAPAGHQYVRVASDILMLAVGTRMVAGVGRRSQPASSGPSCRRHWAKACFARSPLGMCRP